MDTYEKKYDEALEQAKKELAACGSMDCGAARLIFRLFPQLVESEDERIRKELLSFIESVQHSYLCATDRREKWIAYLEKQKYDRMKPVYDNQDSFESALEKAWKDYNDSGARTVDGCEDDYVECAHAKGFREGYLFGIEKQQEQKPAWSEEDERMLSRCIKSIETSKQFADSGTFKEAKDKEIDWLKSFSERFNLQPKQEWSEEDEKMRYFVTEAVQSRYSDRELSKYIDPGIIKEKKQLKQRLFDWLRDLRPSWKPSEQDELMKLKYAGTSTKLD